MDLENRIKKDEVITYAELKRYAELGECSEPVPFTNEILYCHTLNYTVGFKHRDGMLSVFDVKENGIEKKM